MAPTAICAALTAWAAFHTSAKRAGRDLEVQLHGGAGRLGGDRLRGADEPLHPVDVEVEVLTARRDDLVVEQRVAVDVGKVRRHQVVPVERRQNADHHDSRVDFPAFPVGICE